MECKVLSNTVFQNFLRVTVFAQLVCLMLWGCVLRQGKGAGFKQNVFFFLSTTRKFGLPAVPSTPGSKGAYGTVDVTLSLNRQTLNNGKHRGGGRKHPPGCPT